MPTQPAATPSTDRPKRLTLSQILEHMLQRGSSDRSSVGLTRNAKGATQIEVTVRTGNQDDAHTVEAAAERAVEVYDALRLRYPNVEDDAPIAVPPESDAAAAIRARAERWVGETPNADDTPTQLARDVLALLTTLRLHAAAGQQPTDEQP